MTTLFDFEIYILRQLADLQSVALDDLESLEQVADLETVRDYIEGFKEQLPGGR